VSSQQRKQQRDAHIHEKARYMLLVQDVLGSLQSELKRLDPPIVRTQHIGPFTGAPDDFAVTWIFETRADARRAKENNVAEAVARLLLDALRIRDYPAAALNTFRFYTASEDEIRDAGGDFAFFR
jgi:hypothetical protein